MLSLVAVMLKLKIAKAKGGDVSIYSAEVGSAILGIERTNGGASPIQMINDD